MTAAAIKPVAVPRLPFIDLQAQRRRISDKVDAAIARVLAHGAFIMGPEVFEFERRLAAYAGVGHCISCANGTDAIGLALMAKGIAEGDAVFVPDFTFVATAEAVAWLGATPIFVDVEAESFNLDPASLERAIEHAKKLGLKPRAILPVDLFGQPADYRRIAPIAQAYGLVVVADAAQSFGARLENRRVGALAHLTTTSFFPSKPLGCYGDGGAILTDDGEAAELLRSLRVHGQGSTKYDNVRIGINGRLDTIQASILLEKLAIFDSEIEMREGIARRYTEALGRSVPVPRLMPGATSVWAQYTILVPDRAKVQKACEAAGVPTMIYYPIPLSRQIGYRHYPSAPGGLPVSERLAGQVLSLPMHAYLEPAMQDRVVAAVRAGVGR
jgi:dTDP-4-amino-4,6-dideoxygalactose transaminase